MKPAENENMDLLLSRYLDGELSRRQQRKLEERLEQDAALREELRLLASLDGQLSAMAEEVPAGADLDWQRAEIISAVERKALLTPVRRRLILRPAVWGSMAAAAVLAIAASAGIRYFGTGTKSVEPTVTMSVLPATAAAVEPAVVVMDVRPPGEKPAAAGEVKDSSAGSAIAVSVGPGSSPATAAAAEEMYAMY